MYGGEVYGKLAACVSKGKERQDRLIFPVGQRVIVHEICARMLFRTRDGHVSCLWSRTRVEMASSSRGVLLVQNELRDAHLHLVFTDDTGGYPGGVWDSSLLYVTARPATKAPVTSLYLRGRRCTATPNALNLPTTHVPQPLLHPVRRLRASQAHTDSDVALLTEPVPRSVRQV